MNLSKQLFALDVPNILESSIKFQYNYFVIDESINEVPTPIKLNSNNQTIDLNRYPRYCKLQWTITDTVNKKLTNKVSIQDNINAIIYEELLTGDFVGINISDKNLLLKKFDLLNQQSIISNTISTKDEIVSEQSIAKFQISTKYINTIFESSKYMSLLGNYVNFNELQQNNIQSIEDQNINDIIVPYIDIKQNGAGTSLNKPELIGFQINKFELLQDGTLLEKKTIYIENSMSREYIDTAIKYGTSYKYKIRAIYKLDTPAIDNDSGVVNIVTLLIASQVTKPLYVDCIETIAPPPPVELKFVWDYVRKNPKMKSIGSLMLNWSFPINTQRDIKYFQILRRRTINDPYELVKMFDFDDSSKKANFIEEYDERILDKELRLYWIDDDFIKTSKYIYTMCSIDAHGYISRYGEQFEVGFDVARNKLYATLISHSGAPRTYPNIFLENDMFIDTIQVNGKNSTKLSLYLDTTCTSVINNDNCKVKAIYSLQDNASYQLQLINLDNHNNSLLKINIDDSFRKLS